MKQTRQTKSNRQIFTEGSTKIMNYFFGGKPGKCLFQTILESF